MKIDKKLLNKQIATLSKQLNKTLTEKEREHIEGLLNMLGDIADSDVTNEFPNGFESWHETHFEIVQAIVENQSGEICSPIALKIAETKGIIGLYELAKELTDEFENKYKGEIWGETKEYFDTIEEFLTIILHSK